MHAARTLVAAVLLLTACGAEPAAEASASTHVVPELSSAAAVDGPGATLAAAFDHLRGRRVGSFVLMMAPPAELKRMRDEWAALREEPVDEIDDAELRETMHMLTAEGAEDALFAMVQPHLAEARQQLDMLAAMGPMMVAGAIGESGAPEDTLAMVEQVAAKLAKVDIASEEKVQRAIAIVCEAAREIDVPDGAALQKLKFEEALGKSDRVYAAVLDVLAVYGLDLKETLDSLAVNTVSTEGDRAQVEVTVSPFGLEPRTFPVELERADGRWFFRKPEPEGAGGTAR